MTKKYTEDEIKVVSASEHVRLRPKMYFETCFSEESLDALPFEVLCHALDEHMDGNCSEINISVQRDSFSVNYNTGISLETAICEDLSYAEMIFTQIRACSNLKKHLTVGDEFCKLGMATINFASEKCELITYSKDKKGTFTFENGITTSKRIEDSNGESARTEIHMKPNCAVFEGLSFSFAGIEKKALPIQQQFSELTLTLTNETT